MKCGGKGLEIEFDLSSSEVSELLNGTTLRGMADMWDYDERRYSIDVELSTRIEENMRRHFRTEMVLERTYPKGCYFLHADKIEFYLGEEMQDQLRRLGRTGSRFGTGGKIKISDVSRADMLSDYITAADC